MASAWEHLQGARAGKSDSTYRAFFQHLHGLRDIGMIYLELRLPQGTRRRITVDFYSRTDEWMMRLR